MSKKILIDTITEYHPSLLRNIEDDNYLKLASLKDDEDNSKWRIKKLESMTNDSLKVLKGKLSNAWSSSGLNPQKRTLLRLSKQAQKDSGIHRVENYNM